MSRLIHAERARRLNMRGTFALFILFIILAFAVDAAIIRVPTDQPTIQAGIDWASPGDTVLVADGNYTGNGNWGLDFSGKDITVISENGPDNCFIDGQGLTRLVTFQSGESGAAVLEGFTLQNGFAITGGAIRCTHASPVIRGNVFSANRAGDEAGAIFLHDSSALVTGNLFTGNQAERQHGGAILSYEASPVISGNRFEGNLAENGGAINCRFGSIVIDDNTIRDNVAESYGGAIASSLAAVTITGNLIEANVADGAGGIGCSRGAVEVTGNRIADNTAEVYCGAALYEVTGLFSRNVVEGNRALSQYGGDGGGMRIYESSIQVSHNIFIDNYAAGYGGGITMYGSSPLIINNLFAFNTGDWHGGAMFMRDCRPQIINCTIDGNSAGNDGGGIFATDSEVTVANSIFWENDAVTGTQVAITDIYGGTSLSIRYSDVDGGEAGVYVGEDCTLTWGDGMIDADPEFVNGPESDYYLAQEAAGQDVTSPCVDTGDPAGELVGGTTRTDSVPDIGIVDMGFHSPWLRLLVAGPGPGYANQPLVRILAAESEAEPFGEFSAYGSPHYGVKVTCGNLDADSANEILTGAGPGGNYGPHVRAFEADGTPLPGLSFFAYGTSKYGVNVAAGDLDGDGIDEIITGAGPGEVFGPHVRAFTYHGPQGTSPFPGVSYFAYGTPRWGVNVSAGDIDGDGNDEIITGAGPGTLYGPHVRGWDVDGGPATAISRVSFLAYGTHKYGVEVTCGDVDGDGIDEIITGAGPGASFGAHVRGWNYDGLMIEPLQGFSFFAWPPSVSRYGAEVYAGADITGDGRDDVVVGCGPDPGIGTPVKVFLYDDTQISEWRSLEAFPGLTHGAGVAAGQF